MPMPALKAFAKKLSGYGINTLIMEWEGTYPFEKHPLIPNRYAYTKAEIVDFIKYCNRFRHRCDPFTAKFWACRVYPAE